MNVESSIAVLRLDRPDKGNALSAALVSSLQAQLRDALADSQVHTLAFVGEGPNFCTGFDLSDLDRIDDAALLQRFVQIELLLDAVWRAPVRTVAFAHGRTWGAGADLFAACDVRLVAADATFRFPGAAFGLVLGTRRLSVRVGRDEARRLTCDGASLDADAALRCRLATGKADGFEHVMAHCASPATDRLTLAALRTATGYDDADADLAALVRSAARPGLQERIAAYRTRSAPSKATRRIT
jgi:enoyl-CoA hydratase/carnithine racemase